MTSLESIEKLRAIVGTPADGSMRYPTIAKFMDEIEREIAERYIELPVDAGGVPIRFGDTVREVDDCVPMKVVSLTFYEDCVDVNACGMNPKLLVHVKPRTVEDVLEEFLHTAADACAETNCELEEQISKYANELRELLGGDGR